MAMRVPKFETVFIAVVPLSLLSGLILQVTGFAPRAGAWLSLVGLYIILLLAVSMFDHRRS